MPIFDQGYQHWHGRLAGHAWRWLAITRQGVAAAAQEPLASWLVILGACVPAADARGLPGPLGAVRAEVEPARRRSCSSSRTCPRSSGPGPQAYRTTFWTMAFHQFFDVEIFFSMLLVLLVGPDLISQDLRFNAIPLYFSRPVRRIDYFLGQARGDRRRSSPP